METINIDNKIDKKDYQRFIVRKSYKNPVVIIFTIVGFCCLVFSVLWITGAIPKKEDVNPPFPAMFFGLFSCFLPYLTKRSSSKIYDAHPKLNSETKFSFSDEGIYATGTDFSSSVGWNSIIKVEESDKFLLLYTSKTAAEIINKQSLNAEQVKSIKAMAFKM